MKPFGHPDYRSNADRVHARDNGDAPCAWCGRSVLYPFKYMVRVVDGGGRFGRVNEPDGGPGEMGMHPIGYDCARRLRKAGVEVQDQ